MPKVFLTGGPERRAGMALHKAVKEGRVIKLPCEVCGNVKSEAHHENYDEPLIVKWLCRKHHKAEHAKLDSPQSVCPECGSKNTLFRWKLGKFICRKCGYEWAKPQPDPTQAQSQKEAAA